MLASGKKSSGVENFTKSELSKERDLRKICIYFVVTGPLNDNTKRDFNTSISYLRKLLAKKQIKEIKASAGFSIIASRELDKTDVFVFDQFEGDFFQRLQQTKAIIIGVRCLVTSLTKNENIPFSSYPVFTSAMKDLRVSASGISLSEKEKLCGLIQWMGGHYFKNFGSIVTHLISNTIKSKKYEVATTNGIPVMHMDWVQRVWSRSCEESINAVDEEFQKYRLPIFFGTNITSTGLDVKDKNEVLRLVNENGGTYHRDFRSEVIDIVVIDKMGTNSQKYYAAVLYKKEILQLEWIYDSVKKGFALPTKDYTVEMATNIDRSLLNFTSLSQISGSSLSSKSRYDNFTERESVCKTPESRVHTHQHTNSELAGATLKRKASVTSYELIYDKICPIKAKSAGSFLNGCCIHLTGFQPDEMEKLYQILNTGGANIYDRVNKNVTHIIMGDIDDVQIKAWKEDPSLASVHIVVLEWLLQSIYLKKPACGVDYRALLQTNVHDSESIRTKKVFRSMNQRRTQVDGPLKKNLLITGTDENGSTVNIAEKENVLTQYSQDNMPISTQKFFMPKDLSGACNIGGQKTVDIPAQNVTVKSVTPIVPLQQNTLSNVIDFENLDFFNGMVLYIWKDHFTEEFYTDLVEDCQQAQGTVVEGNYKDVIDYTIVSCERSFNPRVLSVNTCYIITDLYLESCMKINKLLPIEYYHQHIPHTANSKPLCDMTIVISLYTGLERNFIESLARVLGANVNNTFMKKEKSLLVCPSPEGSKYEGAMKWRYPVVNSNWLVQCAAQGTKLPFHNYLVGGSPEEFPTSPESQSDVSSVSNNHDAKNQRNTFEYNTNVNLHTNRITELSTGPLRNSHEHDSSFHSPRLPTNTHIHSKNYFDTKKNNILEIEGKDQSGCALEIVKEICKNQPAERGRLHQEAITPINSMLFTSKGISDSCSTAAVKKHTTHSLKQLQRLTKNNTKLESPLEELRRGAILATHKKLRFSDNKSNGLSSTLVNKNEPVGVSKSASTRRATVCTATATTTSTSTIPSTAAISTATTISATTGDMCSLNNLSSSHKFLQSLNNSRNVYGSRERLSLVSNSNTDIDKFMSEEANNEIRDNRKLTSATSTLPEFIQIREYLKNIEIRERNMKRSALQKMDETEIMDTEGHYVQTFESEQFGAGTEDMVEWRDPTEFNAERRLRTKTEMQYTEAPCFSISCNDMEMRDGLINKIVKLGGKVVENLIQYDPSCTHFICERPSRAEKYLGCMASGKWILHIKYIEESFAKDSFTDEELYEWGNCKALNLPQITHTEQIIAQASHRWRKILSEASKKGDGAFTGFRVILNTSVKFQGPLKNIIEAGNGIIIAATSPFKKENGAHLATHCFVDIKTTPINDSDFKFLKRHNVQVLSQMYINAHLIYGTDTNVEQYEIKL